MTRRGVALFILMSVVWGLPYLFIKVAVRDLTPATVVGARTAIGAIVLLPLALRQCRLGPLLRAWKPLLVYCVVEMAVPWWLLSDAERRLPSSLSGLLIATVPLIAVILAALTGHVDRFDRRGVIGLLIGLAGVVVLLGFDVGTGDLGAVGMVGLVAVGYAIGPLVASRYLGHLPSLGLATISLVAVACVYAPFAVWQRPARMPAGTVVASVLLLGLVCTALAFVAFFELIKEIGSTRSTLITYVNPAVAVILGVVLLGERFTASTAIGFILILAGCGLSTAARSPVPEMEGAAGPAGQVSDQRHPAGPVTAPAGRKPLPSGGEAVV